MEHLIKFQNWLPWSKASKKIQDMRQLVEKQLDKNTNIVLFAYRYGDQVRSRVIQIPITASEKIIIKRIGTRCQISRGEEILDIEQKEFQSYWDKCISKKYKFIYNEKKLKNRDK
jgi:hypothetical protein